jgi:predicted nucleic acid-binding protein
MAFKVFLDTNIILDHLQKRNPYSVEIIKYCELKKVEGFTSTASFYTIAYFTEKYKTVSPKLVIRKYANLIHLIPTSNENISTALSSAFSDLEDAFQYFTALNINDLDFFITNNSKDFESVHTKLPIVTSIDFVKMFSVK